MLIGKLHETTGMTSVCLEQGITCIAAERTMKECSGAGQHLLNPVGALQCIGERDEAGHLLCI